MRADYDSPQAGKTRRQVFDRCCDEPTLMCVTHFPSAGAVMDRQRLRDAVRIGRRKDKTRGEARTAVLQGEPTGGIRGKGYAWVCAGSPGFSPSCEKLAW
jgi:hypothetical protein